MAASESESRMETAGFLQRFLLADGTALWAFLEHVPPPTGKAAPAAALPLNRAVEQI